MALINCPECNSQISDVANSCPKCGYPIAAKNAEIKTKTIVKKSDKSVGCIAALICFAAVVLFLIIINKCSSDDSKKTDYSTTSVNTSEYTSYSDNGINNIDNTRVLKSNWKNAGEHLPSISKVLVKNNIYGCGEYYIYEITANEFALACTGDGKTWSYYVIYPKLDKIYRANEKMYFEQPY